MEMLANTPLERMRCGRVSAHFEDRNIPSSRNTMSWLYPSLLFYHATFQTKFILLTAVEFETEQRLSVHGIRKIRPDSWVFSVKPYCKCCISALADAPRGAGNVGSNPGRPASQDAFEPRSTGKSVQQVSSIGRQRRSWVFRTAVSTWRLRHGARACTRRNFACGDGL